MYFLSRHIMAAFQRALIYPGLVQAWVSQMNIDEYDGIPVCFSHLVEETGMTDTYLKIEGADVTGFPEKPFALSFLSSFRTVSGSMEKFPAGSKQISLRPWVTAKASAALIFEAMALPSVAQYST